MHALSVAASRAALVHGPGAVAGRACSSGRAA